MKKILIIRLGAMGDVIFTSPIPRLLKKQLGAEVHFITKHRNADILNANPYVDHLHLFEGDLDKNLKTLSAINFDYVIDLQSNIRSKRIVRDLNKESFTVDKLGLKKWLIINFGINKLPDAHFAHRCMDSIASLGVKDDGLGMDFFFPPDYEFKLAELPKTYLVLVLGATHHTKRIPLDKLGKILAGVNAPIILIGGKDVKSIAKDLTQQFESDHVVNMVAKCSIQDSAYIIKHSKLVVAPDTGMLHLAAALKKPTISIWGSTIPEFGVFPFYGNANVYNELIENKSLSCRPCSKHGSATCPKGHFKCMNDLNTADLVEKINSFID